MKNNIGAFILFICIIVLSSCTANKFLAEDEYYYQGSSVQYKPKALKERGWMIQQQVAAITNTPTNEKVFGLRPGVWFYHIAGEPKKDRGFKHWLKYKVGSKPILLLNTQPDLLGKQVQGYLVNKGYFDAAVDHKIIRKKKSATIRYTVDLGRVTRIREINYPRVDSVYQPMLSSIEEKTILAKGQPYDLERLQQEQQRIEDYLENKGFYYFDSKYLVYEADSTVGDKLLDLQLILKPQTPADAKVAYAFNDIFIHPNYTINSDSDEGMYQLTDTTTRIYDDDKKRYMRPDILDDLIVMNPRETYTKTAEQYTLEHLVDIGTYKFINVKFNKADSATLDSHIYLTPFTKKSIRFDAQAVSKSNNFVGPSLSVSFSNRNTFGGGELLKTSLNGAYEIQVNGQNNPALSTLELGFNSTLAIPRLVTPFNIDYYNWRFFPDTKIRLGAKLQDRISVFRLTSFEAAYGFNWKENESRQHNLFPVSVSYVRLGNESDELLNRLRLDDGLANSLNDQFILGATYEYTLSTKAKEKSDMRRHNFYLNVLGDLGGNLLSLIHNVSGKEEDDEGRFKLLGLNYAQYFKVSTDFRHFLNLGKNHELASRFLIGAGWAYGNASNLPFIKQFASGGANSIRAFRSRSLGPGAADNQLDESTTNFFDQTGDMRVELNFDYRFPIYGVLKGGLFVDTGNIWLLNDRNDDVVEGYFEIDEFTKEIAVGTGVGLRLDFSFFLLRFDLAFPLRDPSLEPDSRWVIDDISPLDKSWRRDNLILNIAIGHAF